MSVRDYYDQYWSAEGFHPTGQRDPAVCRVLQHHIEPRSRVLDVGCGDGLAAGAFLQERGCDYVGADVSENAVREASDNGFRASLIDDAASLPFADNEFDAVVSMEVIEHLLYPLNAVQEALRVLKPGGILLLTTPNTTYWRLRLDMLLLGKWNPLGDDLAVEQPWRDPHIRFFTTGSLSRMLGAAGCTSIHVGGCKGHFIKSLPGFQRLFGRYLPAEASWLYRHLEHCWPSALAARLYSMSRKPGVSPQASAGKDAGDRAGIESRAEGSLPRNAA